MARILIVEDNLPSSELAKAILEMNGHEILCAGSAEQGILLAQSEQPDLVLMDLSLPRMDGLTATRQLKQSESTGAITVVALTARAMKIDELSVFEAGCSGYISKPFDAHTFAGLVQGYLEDV